MELLGSRYFSTELRAIPQRTLDLFWRRVEDAKRRLDALHKVVPETKLTTKSGQLSPADSAGARAVYSQQSAASAYLHAVDEFMVAITINETPQPTSEGQSLSPRQRDVLALVASGKSSRHIANELGIAFKTVVTHRHHLHKKWNGAKRAAIFTINSGLQQGHVYGRCRPAAAITGRTHSRQNHAVDRWFLFRFATAH